MGGLAHVVRDAGPEAYLDEPIEIPGGRGLRRRRWRVLITASDRGRRLPVPAPPGEFAVQGVNLHGPHRFHGDMEVLVDAAFDLFSQGVPDAFRKPISMRWAIVLARRFLAASIGNGRRPVKQR